jgi:diguanylate cyclase (GGDEF)-like protein
MVFSRVTKHYALALLNLRLREKLRIEAIRDPLTALYNRRYMEESLDREALRARRRGTPVGILMFDIDHFKTLNDTYGHEAGDKVLEKLGMLFRKYTRSEDVACRYGGEEFLLILPEAPLQTVLLRAEELRKLIKDHLRIPWQEVVLSVTISVGVAAFPHHGQEVKQVVAAADGALYQAKKQGRDQVVVAPSSGDAPSSDDASPHIV